MAEQTQNYENHRTVDYTLYVLAVLVLASLLLTVVAMAGFGEFLIPIGQILLAIAILGVMLRMRAYGLTVQDRVVRLEMLVRLARLGLEDKAGQLSLKQLIALRFASDEELPELVDKVISDNITDGDEIKRQVKNWQADFQRI